MASLRVGAFLFSLMLHGAVAYALLHVAGGDALDEGSGEDIFRVELGLISQGLHETGEDIESVDGTDLPAEAESVAQQQVEEVSAVEPPETPVEEVERVETVEETHEVITSEAGPEPEIVQAAAPEVIEAKEHQEKQEASVAQEAQEQERRAAARELKGGSVAENRAYLRKLSSHLRRRKVNPRSRATGTAVVSFTVDRSGRVISRKIAKSSGSKVLDDAAIASVERASPFPPFPSGVSGEPLQLTVPFRFRTR